MSQGSESANGQHGTGDTEQSDSSACTRGPAVVLYREGLELVIDLTPPGYSWLDRTEHRQWLFDAIAACWEDCSAIELGMQTIRLRLFVHEHHDLVELDARAGATRRMLAAKCLEWLDADMAAALRDFEAKRAERGGR